MLSEAAPLALSWPVMVPLLTTRFAPDDTNTAPATLPPLVMQTLSPLATRSGPVQRPVMVRLHLCTKVTVTVKDVVTGLLESEESVAVQVTVVVPTGDPPGAGGHAGTTAAASSGAAATGERE